MKEESWSIRKMRELQKLSTTRNTYKRDDDGVISLNDDAQDKTDENVFTKFYQKLSLFLEE